MVTIAAPELESARAISCEPQHPGGLHIKPREAEAVRELFRRYASGSSTLSQLAEWMNDQGFRTRNRHWVEDGLGNRVQEARHFTTASIRGILHNRFYTGKIRHGNELLPGVHQALVSDDVFDTVQAAMKRNSGRSETLRARPEREYLLKGLIRCAYCLLPMWAQTYKNGNRYYREHKGSRGDGYCVNRSRSMACDVPDAQIGQIMQSILLPDAWMDRVLARVHLAGELDRIAEERLKVDQRLKRLGKAYVDGLYGEDDYKREKRYLEEQAARMVIPGVDAAMEAGKLLEDLPMLWEKASMAERRKLLTSMLEAVYVDTVEEKAIVAIRPKPAFMPLFEIANTREGSDVFLINEPPQASIEPEAADSCFWWRRGRVEAYLKHGLAVLVAISWGGWTLTRTQVNI